ncbi:hypothetical protein DYI37_14760 [Fulvimarina endophytica]|uniref:DUF4148 domain-containing protein n=1 Tax=Fulvimarina endophytica TaxID=2293836 RepID=A0A371WZW0_9HYPH|nr:hypothetical protein [Fulvimarina endophytica]RFC62518.1 hypothetical protein DYI37_14760 [Fulvimarina endophytica]
MFKTTLLAATIAATSAMTLAASAQGLVPGSRYYDDRSDETARVEVTQPTAGVTTVQTSQTYGYTQTVPGSSYGRTAANEAERASVQQGTAGSVDAPRVSTNAGNLVPGSSYND